MDANSFWVAAMSWSELTRPAICSANRDSKRGNCSAVSSRYFENVLYPLDLKRASFSMLLPAPVELKASLLVTETSLADHAVCSGRLPIMPWQHAALAHQRAAARGGMGPGRTAPAPHEAVGGCARAFPPGRPKRGGGRAGRLGECCGRSQICNRARATGPF